MLVLTEPCRVGKGHVLGARGKGKGRRGVEDRRRISRGSCRHRGGRRDGKAERGRLHRGDRHWHLLRVWPGSGRMDGCRIRGRRRARRRRRHRSDGGIGRSGSFGRGRTGSPVARIRRGPAVGRAQGGRGGRSRRRAPTGRRSRSRARWGGSAPEWRRLRQPLGDDASRTLGSLPSPGRGPDDRDREVGPIRRNSQIRATPPAPLGAIRRDRAAARAGHDCSTVPSPARYRCQTAPSWPGGGITRSSRSRNIWAVAPQMVSPGTSKKWTGVSSGGHSSSW